MASHDVRDVLNLPSEGAGTRPSKKQKTSAPRPNLKGLAREVQNLGGDNPIAIVPEISTFKKRRFGSRKPAARWNLAAFGNSARGDGSLHLRHWRKQGDAHPAPVPPTAEEQAVESTGAPVPEPRPEIDPVEDSAFSKFNVQVEVPSYTEDQYTSNLASNDWTKDETDYLLELAKEYDLRWPLIWDRYEYQAPTLESLTNGDTTDPSTAVVQASKPRTMEDLKARYYEIAAKMMAVDTPVQFMTQAQFNLHEIMANFNPLTELTRKRFAENSLSRSKEEAREEESLLVEVRRILARTERFNQERRDLYSRLDYPQADHDINTFKTSAGLGTLLQNLAASANNSKKRRSLMEANGAATPSSAQPSSAQPASTPVSESRRESIAAGAHRDSVGNSDRPERPTKKGQQPQPERKKLTEQEEKIYGVSHHDRLPTGPTFRYERINKILTTKSHAQHQRIMNTLTELDVPSRVNMPTRPVVEEMEKLLSSIGVLLDIRKINDKLETELKLEQAKKAERERLAAPAQPAAESPDKKQSKKAVNGIGSQEQDKKSDPGTKDKVDSQGSATKEAGAASNDDSAAPQQQTKANGDASETAGPDESAEAASKSSEAITKVKQEASDDKGVRPGSSGGHKRSASVLSSVSDKSSKRQKKQ